GIAHGLNGGRHDARRVLSLPVIDLVLRRRGRGVVAAAQERELRLFLVPHGPRVAAFARQDRRRRTGVAGTDDVDAVRFVFLGRDHEHEQLAVFRELIIRHVVEGALAVVGQIAESQLRAEGGRDGGGAGTALGPFGALALEAAFSSLAGRGRFALVVILAVAEGALLIGDKAGGVLGQLKRADAIDPDNFAVCQLDDAEL